MNDANLVPRDWVLIESSARSDTEEDYRIVQPAGEDSESECRTLSGAAALSSAIRRIAPRRVILDFHVSFRRGLDLLRLLKEDFPGMGLLARVRLPPGTHPDPLYFTVEVGPAGGVSFHRLTAHEGAEPASDAPLAQAI